MKKFTSSNILVEDKLTDNTKDTNELRGKPLI